MFKKPIKITNYHKISKKAQKKLKNALKKHLSSIQEIFENESEIYIKKVEKSKMLIYCNSQNPLFVDTTSKNDFFPTMYTLSKFPNCVKFSLKMKLGVENFLKRGAHLMWPGVSNINDLPYFESDELVGIKTFDGQFFGIAAIACCKNDIEGESRVEGVAAYVLHFVGDTLFDLGTGDCGFKEVRVEERLKEVLRLEDFEVLKEEEVGEVNDDGNKILNEENQILNGVEEIINDEENKILNDNEEIIKDEENKIINDEEIVKDEENKILNDDGEIKNEEPEKKKLDSEEERKMAIEKMDEDIIEAFFNSIFLSVKEKDFPIENSTFWNKHIIKCRKSDNELNIKKSSFKKLGKFFQYLNNKKYIVYKEASKKIATPQILRINKNNYEIKNWDLTIKKMIEEKEIKKKEENNFKVEIKNKIINFCQPKSKIKKFLNLGNEDILFENFKKILKKFLYEKKLIRKDIITINTELQKEFGNDLKKKPKKNLKQKKNKIKENEIKFVNFLKIIERNLKFYYIISNPEKKTEKRINGKFEGIQIIADKLNNRYITKITNLDIFGIDLEKLISIWKIKFGTSGSIQDVQKGKLFFKEIFLQGGFCDVLKDFLIDIGFEEDLIKVVKKCVKPVRRKRK